MKEKGRQMMCFKKKRDGNGMVPTFLLELGRSQNGYKLAIVHIFLKLNNNYYIYFMYH